MLLPYLKRVCGETRFLLREADECKDRTVEQEEDFISSHTESERASLILGFPIDHSFLKYKKELSEYGYQVGKISMKEETVSLGQIKQ